MLWPYTKTAMTHPVPGHGVGTGRRRRTEFCSHGAYVPGRQCREETKQGHGLCKGKEGVNSDRMAREGIFGLVTLRGETKD